MRNCALIVWLLFALPVWANEDAGQIVFVAGTLTAERGPDTVALAKTDPIYEQDVIVTAPRSRGQLLMRDGAKYALRPETRFAVIEYFMTGDERLQPDGSVIVATQDSAVTGLVKGGFRAITGAINGASYEVDTPAATMGIRGTKYSVVWCAGDCELPPGVIGAKPILDGLYVGVSEGIVSIKNNTGEFLVRAGQYSYVRNKDTRPVSLLEQPAALIDTFPTDLINNELAAAEVRETFRIATGSKPKVFIPPEFPGLPGTQAPTGFPTGPDGPITAVPKRIIDNGPPPLVALASGPVSGLITSGFASTSKTGQRDFDIDDLTALEVPLRNQNTNVTYGIGSSSITNTGFDPVSGFRWGRWSGGAATVTATNGPSVRLDLRSQSLHWVYGPPQNTKIAIPLTGRAYYSVIAGGTNPTDTFGNIGVIGGASLLANFTTATVENLLVVDVGGNQWSASGSGPITNELFNGSYNVFVNGQGGGSGSFSGFFGASAADGFPSAAALTYGLNFDTFGNGQNVSVSGAVVLHPTPSP